MARTCVFSASAIPSPPPAYGALEGLAFLSAAELAKGGHDVTFVGAKGSKRPEGCQLIETVEPAYEGVEIEERSWKAFEANADLLNYDVLVDHSHFKSSYRWKKTKPELKVAFVFHDLLPCLIPPPMNTYDELFGVSRFHAGFLRDRWGVPVEHLYNGVSLETFPLHKEKKEYALFLSRLSEGKGAHHFVEACGRAGIPGIVAGEDRPEFGIRPSYVNDILRMCNAAGVEYMGPVDSETRLRLMQEAKVFCQPLDPTYAEVFGMTYVESLACGTPVVTSSLGAGPEIISEDTGIIAEADGVSMAKALGEAWGREWSAEVCRERAEVFSVERFGESYRGMVDRLVGAASPGS